MTQTKRATGSKPNQRDGRATIAEGAARDGWRCAGCSAPISARDSVRMHNPPGSDVTAVIHTRCIP